MRLRVRGHHPLRPGIQPGSPRTWIYHRRPARRRRRNAPATPMPQPPTGNHTARVWPDPLSLATTHGVSIPAGTEMFHFPAYPPHTKCGTGPSRPVGSPIRKSSDQRPVDGSPRPIAVSYVLHRSCLPRHPPYALAGDTPAKHKATARRQINRHYNQITKRSERTPNNSLESERNQQQKTTMNIVSCSRPLSSSQTTTHPPATTAPANQDRATDPWGSGPHRDQRLGVAIREPKSASVSTPTPTARPAGDKPTISSTPAPPSEPRLSRPWGPHRPANTGLNYSVERR